MTREWITALWQRCFNRDSAPQRMSRKKGRRSKRLRLEVLEDRTVFDASLNQAFVTVAYQGLLDRTVDQSGLNYWSGQLNNGASRSAVLNGIMASPEYLSDTVENLYQTFLRRTASSNETAYWIAQNKSGTSWQQIEADIVASPEYASLSGGSLNGFLSLLYTDVLHRTVDSAGLSFFQQEANSGASRQSMALQIITSPEASQLLVSNDYQEILSRPADSGGLAYWTNLLTSTGNPGAVFAGILGSDELINQYQQALNSDSINLQAQSLTPVGADPNTATADAFLVSEGKFGIAGATLGENTSPVPNSGLVFASNVGQTDPQVQYVAQAQGYNVFLTQSGPVLFTDATDANSGQQVGLVLAMNFNGANAKPLLTGTGPLASTSNYFGGESSYTDVPNYSSVTYTNMLPGVDVVYTGGVLRVEQTFVVHPGGNPNAISFSFPGWTPSIAADGSLVLYNAETNTTAYMSAPKMSQPNGRLVAGGFVLLAGGQIGFQVGAYDSSQTLTIDPSFVYSTFIGGSNADNLRDTFHGNFDGGQKEGGMVVDSAGNVYVTGTTNSVNFPTTPSAFATTAPNTSTDVFVSKLSASGSKLLYSTYLGNGTGTSSGGISIDSNGDAYITGDDSEFFSNPSFPTTAGAYDTTPGFQNDVFVTKLNPAGDKLLYSTFLGGNFFSSSGMGIVVDSTGAAYVTGFMAGNGLKTTPGAFESNTDPRVVTNDDNAFVAKLNPAGSGLDYATYVTGTGAFLSGTIPFGIAIDGNGDAYITGKTLSTDFPTTPGAPQTTLPGSTDAAFVAKLNSTGTALAFSTYLGGTATNNSFVGVATVGSAIAVDSAGNIYIDGLTDTTDFPTTTGAYETAYQGGNFDAFVTKYNSSGTVVWSTYLGSPGDDEAFSIAVDTSQNVYVGGITSSVQFPQLDAVQSPLTTINSTNDGFVTELNPAGSTILFSTNIGGLKADEVDSVALGSNNSIYVAGQSQSTSGYTNLNNDWFPIMNAFQQGNNTTALGGWNIFVAKLTPASPGSGSSGVGNGSGTSSNGSGAGSGATVVSTSDIYSPNNNSSDTAHDFGSLAEGPILEYDNLVIGRTPVTNLPEYEWFKWEASTAGTFYATLTTSSGGPLEMHLFEVQNGSLTELSNTTGGTLSAALAQGQTIYVEVKGSNPSLGVYDTGDYFLDVSLQH
jgi:Domain of unknown function (DUF4214)/Beta-propeller repeat